MNMKNKIFYFLSGFICIILIAACGSIGIRNSALKQDKKNDAVTINVSFWEPSIEREFENAFTHIAEKYNKIKPNVKINLMVQPVNGYQEWMKAQISSDNMPDVEYNQPVSINQQIKSGLIENLENELNATNPYSDSGNLWKDDFNFDKIQSIYKQSDDINMQTYSIPIIGLGLAYFYNESIYENLGLHPPETWDEIMHNFKIIDEAGINPVSLMGQKVDAVDWMAWEICTGLYGEKFLNDTKLNTNGDDYISDFEISQAIRSGYYNISKQGEYHDLYVKYLEILKEYGRYCHNASGLDEIGAKAQFLSGKSAHIFSGSWDVKSFSMNDEIPFKVGFFAFPKFTKENSPYAGDTMTIVSLQPIAVTKSVNKMDGKREATIDFIQFLTAPENYEEFIKEIYNIPVVRGIDIDPVFKLFTGGKRKTIGLYSITDRSSVYNNYSVNLSMLSGETIDMNIALANVQKSLDNIAKTYFQEDGKNP